MGGVRSRITLSWGAGKWVIPTEPIGSIPRPRWLIEAIEKGHADDSAIEALYDRAVCETIAAILRRQDRRSLRMASNANITTFGPTAPTACLFMAPRTASRYPLPQEHVRRMLRLTAGPFRYRHRADEYLDFAHEVCASAAEAGRYFLLGTEFDVSGGAIPGYSRRSSLTIYCGSTKTRFEIAFTRGRTRTD